MIGCIHWNVSLLIQLASFSREYLRTSGTGGGFLLSGLRRLDHFCFFGFSRAPSRPESDESISETALGERVTTAPASFLSSSKISLSGSLSTGVMGRLATGSSWAVVFAPTIGSLASYSFSRWRVGSTVIVTVDDSEKEGEKQEQGMKEQNVLRHDYINRKH
jgi:hypothetical protein